MFAYAHGPIPFVACLVWLLVPIWIIYLVGRMVMNEMDSGLGIIVISCTFFIGAIMFNPPSPLMGSLATWTILLTMILWFPLHKLAERNADKELFVSQVDASYEQLAFNGSNWIAAFRLAKQMSETGYIHHADALAQRVIPNLPKATFREEYRQAAIWNQQAAATPPKASIVCRCGNVILPGAMRCPACGAAWLSDRLRGGRTAGKGSTRVLTVWCLLLAVLFGMPFLASFGAAIAIPGIIALLALALVGVWFVFLRPSAA